MNFYGKTIGPQHTIFGRVAPMMEAMRLAINRAAEQPLTPARQFEQPFPDWGHNIAQELTRTVFKGIVQLAPRGNKIHPRNSGRMIGVLLRAGLFYWKEVPAIWEREGFAKLTPEKAQKLEQATGWELILANASKQAGRPITTKLQLMRFSMRQFRQHAQRLIKATWGMTKHVLNQPMEDVLQFLIGLPEGFKCFLKPDGEFAGRGKRTEVFIVLPMYWPEIEEMRQSQPAVTRKYLLDWLEKSNWLPRRRSSSPFATTLV